ncbi:hypothetical protein OV450_3400 [Actinobacteria bacterium OV450]|nr:hypothetical protein OV450_3400 [Actinobacteria bacterium OV450]
MEKYEHNEITQVAAVHEALALLRERVTALETQVEGILAWKKAHTCPNPTTTNSSSD